MLASVKMSLVVIPPQTRSSSHLIIPLKTTAMSLSASPTVGVCHMLGNFLMVLSLLILSS